ncbi:delta(1)-pyrroline-2-carboxylate reductase family protein [Rivibacter subsaxonicus]|uniref:1-piperideine-2-carboxylate/1-pyrroline-2-carboxylate reductase [NAD(P)H] n=1 Tax=Rivibacter subsaxonicus TaxID=457575 RepID=A0A4Q7VE02_9BURK|nr:delta(1)-pyrroline-2-carboxylate reductase family protein [Rivibacter subsaxonicus]RZT93743.1 1-piperideine-2-carboxylate/1-pyrroline-2-carboxylate reductase [NAD(P)H] [Rivibacter subsaxonicus]
MAAAFALHDATATRELLPAAALVDAVAAAMRARRAGTLQAPPRLVLPLAGGQGSYLAMPAADARLAICKLVSVHPDNPARGLPTIHGQVLVSDAANGVPLALLDGPTVTARRTAAVSLLALRLFGTPGVGNQVTLIGAGPQALEHARMLAELGWAGRLHLVARQPGSAQRLAQTLRDEGQPAECVVHASVSGALAGCEAVICLTTATAPVLPEQLPAATLVIGAGAFKPQMAEISPGLLAMRTIVVDDLDGARHEAGDLLQAGVDWQRVSELADWLDGGVARSPHGVVVKTVGQAAWDLAAAHVAMASLECRA